MLAQLVLGVELGSTRRTRVLLLPEQSHRFKGAVGLFSILGRVFCSYARGSVPGQSQLHLVLHREAHRAHENQAPAVLWELC